MPQAALGASLAAGAGATASLSGLSALVPLAAGIGAGGLAGIGSGLAAPTLGGSLAPIISGIAGSGGLGFGLADILKGLSIARSLTSRDAGANIGGALGAANLLGAGGVLGPGGTIDESGALSAGQGANLGQSNLGESGGTDFKAILGDLLKVFGGQPGANTDIGELLQGASGVIDQFRAGRGGPAGAAANNRIDLRNQVMQNASQQVLQGSQERLGQLMKSRQQAAGQGASTGALDKLINKEIHIQDGALGGLGVSRSARADIAKQFRELTKAQGLTPSELQVKVNDFLRQADELGVAELFPKEAVLGALGNVPIEKPLAERANEAATLSAAQAAGTRAGAPPPPREQTVQFRAPNGDVVDAIVNLDTGQTRIIGQGPAVSTQLDQLPATAQQKFSERVDFQQQAVDQIDKALALPPGSFGVAATVKRGAREAGRVAGDLLSIGVPDAVVGPLQELSNIGGQAIDQAIATSGRLDPALAIELKRSDLTEAKIIETRLAFMLANALQPEGRLLKDTIDSARESVKLSGLFTSERTARERLTTIREIISRSQAGLQSTAPGAAPVAKPKTQSFTYDPEKDELVPAQ